MLKILIVDDELLVRVGLKSTIDWKSHGYMLVGGARNSKEAIELFKKYSPDVLLTDISMPGLSGLELIIKLREINPQLKSIILTHYEDFNYAREAVQLGVLDYILKTNLTSERLLKVLKKAKIQLPEKACTSLMTAEESSKILHKLIFGKLNKEDEEICKNQLPWQALDKCYISVIDINLRINEKHQLDSRQIQTIEHLSNQILSETLFRIVRTIYQKKLIYLFICPVNTSDFTTTGNFNPSLETEKHKHKIIRLMSVLSINLQKYLNLYNLIGISNRCNESYQISYQKALIACKDAFFETNHIFQFNHLEQKSSLQSSSSMAKILSLLEKNKRSELTACVNQVLEEIRLRKDMDGLRRVFDQLVLSVNSANEAIFEKEDFDSLYDYNAVKTHILSIVDLLIKKTDGNDTEQTSYIIRRSINYIENNYARNISLSNLASHVQVSNSYLSFLFKKELGLNFTHYLTRTRIQNAQNLFKKSNMKIYEVAYKVGFESPYYFSKVFKEFTGLTCIEYRNQHYSDKI